MILSESDLDGSDCLVLDAVAGGDHVTTVDEHAAALALADPAKKLKFEPARDISIYVDCDPEKFSDSSDNEK
jgi:hypothetical protein